MCVLYPGLQLRGELGLELADSAIGVVSLDEHFGRDGWRLPHVLQAVSPERVKTCQKKMYQKAYLHLRNKAIIEECLKVVNQ